MSTEEDAEALEVLLVEDDPGDVVLITEAFEHNKVNNRLHVVADGVEALQFLRKEAPYEDAVEPDLVLLDLNLPRKDGREVLEEVKSDPELKHIPVIVLTTSSDEADILQSYRLHANAFVTKPVAFDQFITALQQFEGFWLQVVRFVR